MQEVYFDSLVESLKRRHSTRNFIDSASPKKINKLETFINQSIPINPDVKVVMIKENFSRCLNDYSDHITPVDQGLVFIGKEEPEQLITLGLLGEMAILFATSLSINTCWLYGTFNRYEATKLVELSSEQSIIAVSPLGIGTNNIETLTDSFYLKRLEQRIPAKDFVETDDDEISPLFDAVRIAPSARNRQPWSFTVKNGIIQASLVPNAVLPISFIDQGIAMLHLEIALANIGVKQRFKKTNGKWLLKYK